MNIEKHLKKQKGIIVSDALISILIILLFSGIITSLIISIVKEKTKIKINSQQINLATQILEYTEKISYNDVNKENIINYVNSSSSENISAGNSINSLTTLCKVEINIENIEFNVNSKNITIYKLLTLVIQTDAYGETYKTEIHKAVKPTVQEVKAMIEE